MKKFENLAEGKGITAKFKIDDNLYQLNNKELKNFKPDDFGNGASLYIIDSKSGKIKYIINLKKEKYSTFSLESSVEDAYTYKFLTTPGSGKGFRPYYVDDFLSK